MPETTPARSVAPIERKSARDHSHARLTQTITLQSDTAQRLLENFYPKTDANLEVLESVFMRFIGEPEIARAYASFNALCGHCAEEASQTRLGLESLLKESGEARRPAFDNPRTYEAQLRSWKSQDALKLISAIDDSEALLVTAARTSLLELEAARKIKFALRGVFTGFAREVQQIRNACVAFEQEKKAKKKTEQN